ncbi:netrin receptor DCC [Passer domesticus]|uniref:netrin receptor DCC n=1 Tax=Passer domesticus TaxID=48849 RepID=UPI0030FE1545
MESIARIWLLLLLPSATGFHLPPFTEVKFLQEPSDVVVARGSDLILECSVESDGEILGIFWKKDGKILDLEEDKRRKQLGNGSLWIRNVLHSRHHQPDEGIYQCGVRLRGGGAGGSREAKVSLAESSSIFFLEFSPHFGSSATLYIMRHFKGGVFVLLDGGILRAEEPGVLRRML